MNRPKPDAAIRTYRYGELPPGLSLGVTRHPPRGVAQRGYVAQGFYHVRLPLLAPSAKLLAAYQEQGLPFDTFAARYRAEMKRPEPRQTIRLLAAVSRTQRVNLGCYCADASHCHRTLLAALIEAEVVSQETATEATPRSFFSPACSMPEIED